MVALLLPTKLHVPAVRPELVPRPGLLKRLNAGLNRKLTFISAPAGFGKTTLVAEWLSGAGRPYAWLSLDEGDNDPVRFFTYFIAALQKIEGTIGAAAQSLLQSPPGCTHPPLPADQSLMTALVADMAAVSTPFVLVLDDYHLISELAIHEAVGFLLEHQPPHMHLAIATREDPPLPCARLRARGQMTELRVKDLQFTEAEAAAFLNQVMGLELKPEEVAALEARTEGWIAGLQLAALSLQGEVDRAGFIRTFAGDDRHVMDYLVDEVLSRQPKAVQGFLLQTAVLERLSGPLCDAVVYGDAGAGKSQSILERLERANLFVVPLDNRREWYRYHHLFGELLRHRLEQMVGVEGLAQLQRRASVWCEGNGYVHEAIIHALAAADFERAAMLIEPYADEMIKHSEIVTLLGWLKALPEGVIRSHPLLCVHHAWVLLFTHPVAPSLRAIEQRLQDAENALAARPPAAGEGEHNLHDLVAGQCATIRLLLGLHSYRGHDPKRVITIYSQALERLAEDNLSVRASLTYNIGIAHLLLGDVTSANRAFEEARRDQQASGDYYLAVEMAHTEALIARWRGRLHEAAAICRAGLSGIVALVEQETKGRPMPAAGLLCIDLGCILLEWGDLGNAEQCLVKGLQQIRLTGELGNWTQGLVALAHLKQMQGDMDGALRLVEQVEQLWSEADQSWLEADSYPYGAAYAAALRTRLWLAEGGRDPNLLAHAVRWEREFQRELEDGREEVPIAGNYWRYVKWVILIRLRIAQYRAWGQPSLRPTLERLDQLLCIAETGGWSECVIELLILQALAFDALGEVQRALEALRRALTSAEPEGYLRLFVDEGPPIAHLLYEAAECGIAPEYAGRLLAAFPATAPTSVVSRRLASAMLEPLSEREVEVLRLVADGLSNQEIAQRLFLSPHTVKRHTSNIYGKLGANSRTQAVVKARAFGLLPPV